MNCRLQSYLCRHAQPEAGIVSGLRCGAHEAVLVVPCYDEADDFLDTLLPAQASDLLIIVVVNAPDDAPPEARQRTLRLLKALRGAGDHAVQLAPFAERRNVHLLVVDRATDERLVPRRQGVGLARKIGADCALALLAANAVERRWIYVTDADVTLPDDYLRSPMPESGTALFPFYHAAAQPVLQARAELYELHLRYYVNRLANAGSPYAFHTLGSTTAIHAEAYAKVRGYPRRNAAEDFYLLNKLAKVDAVHPLNTAAITLHARVSHRVPFGTGPALARMPDQASRYMSYAAASFELLREVLDAFAAVSDTGIWQASRQADTLLNELGFFETLNAALRQQRSALTLRKALHHWFDGFRTLRFIHECRRYYPDQPLLATLAELLGSGYAHCAPHGQLDRLRQLETGTPLGLG